MSRKTPTTRDLRGRTVFTRSETHDLPAQEGSDNPWDMMLKDDERKGSRLHRFNWTSLTVCLFIAVAVAVLILWLV